MSTKQLVAKAAKEQARQDRYIALAIAYIRIKADRMAKAGAR